MRRNRFQRACDRVRRNPVNLFRYVSHPAFVRRVLKAAGYGLDTGCFVLGQRLEWHPIDGSPNQLFFSNGKMEGSDHIVKLDEVIQARATGIIGGYGEGMLSFTLVERSLCGKRCADVIVSMTVNDDTSIFSPHCFDGSQIGISLKVWTRVIEPTEQAPTRNEQPEIPHSPEVRSSQPHPDEAVTV